MPTYVTVSAVRIQGWISRTQRLKLLRGASTVLDDATARATLESLLDGRAVWCDEAGEVSGVVVLEASDHPERVASDIVEHLRQRLPRIELEAWWTKADDFVTAYARWAAETTTGRWSDAMGRRLALPPASGVPIAQSCDGCRREPVEGPPRQVRPAGEPAESFGPDCAARLDAPLTDKGVVSVGGRVADSFEDLAKNGGLVGGRWHDTPIGRADRANHLATIAADGNGVGGFMRALADLRPPHGTRLGEATARFRRAVPERLALCLHEGARSAAIAVSQPGQRVQPVIVHLMGGDDLLASVPAPLAWRYAVTLSQAFASEADRALSRSAELRDMEAAAEGDPGARAAVQDLRSRVGRLALGVGMTFAHASHPVADTQALAHDAMREAKEAWGGSSASIGWVDLTADGSLVPDRVVDLAMAANQLGRHTSAPLVFADSYTPSARATLGTILQDWYDKPRPEAADRVGGELRRWARRTRHPLPGSLAPDQRGPVDAADLALLGHDLSRARWWPEPGTTDPQEATAGA